MYRASVSPGSVQQIMPLFLVLSNFFPITSHDLHFMSNTSGNIKYNIACHLFSLWFLARLILQT
jgi:hypothetical protein